MESELVFCSINTAYTLMNGDHAIPLNHIVMVPDELITNGEVVVVPKSEFAEYLRAYPKKVGV
mgnify:CR=1 FL=1